MVSNVVTSPGKLGGGLGKARNGLGSALDKMVASGTFLVIPIAGLVIIMAFASPVFLDSGNLFNILRTASIFAIIGVGQTFVMTAGQIDLSVGSMLAMVMVGAGALVVNDWPIPVAFLFAVLFGASLGVINGLVVAWLRVPALLATLGTLITFRGIVQEYSAGSYITRFPESLVYLGQGMVGPVPVPVIIAATVALIGWTLFRFTRLGRYAVAIGGNERAAIIAGINVRLWKVVIYAFQGALVGVASVVMMARLNAAHPSSGQLVELHVIAGVVIGGTLLFGGRGLVWGTVLGMILIGILENGLLLAGLGFFWQQIFLGLLIIGAVAFQLSRKSNQLKLA